MLNSFHPEDAEKLDARTREMIARRSRVLGPSYKLFYEQPVHFVRAEGVWLYDPEGMPYLDVYNNVPAVGHCHPHVVAAIAGQAASLNTHTRYLYDLVLIYAERLLGTFPSELSNVMFTCTGSEASDLAMRAAKVHTGGNGFIVTENAYHGLTDAVSSLSPSLGIHVPLGINVRTVPPPVSYHTDGSSVKDVGVAFDESVQRAIRDLARHGVKTAALITDTIFSSDGVYSDPAGFLKPAVDSVRRAGGLFIADEVQPGLGRLGSAMWGFQRHDVVPDMAILGKSLGNGIPLAGLVAKPEVLEQFGRQARYFNTFGGNPVSCAAGLAVLEVIDREELMANARDVGAYLKEGLNVLREKHPSIGEIRGTGLFLGAALIDPETRAPAASLASEVVNGLRRRHILISASGPYGNVLKMRPPLPFSRENADQFLATLLQIMADEEG